MSISGNLKFDYLAGSQTQKHLTVNNALAMLDATAQWCVGPQTSSGEDGSISIGQNGKDLDIWLNGGAVTISPKLGWRAYFVEHSSELIFDGQQWQSYHVPLVNCYKFDVDLSLGEAAKIREKSIVFGCTARVTKQIKGEGVTAWMLGLHGAEARYGQGIDLEVNSWTKGITNTPITYRNNADLCVFGEGGVITEGRVLIYLYMMELGLPDEV